MKTIFKKQLNTFVKQLLKDEELLFIPAEYYLSIVEIMKVKFKQKKINNLQYGSWGDVGLHVIINRKNIVIYVKENTFPIAA